MKRVIMHWTAGKYKASSEDKKHYHRIYEGDGTIVNGNFPIRANESPVAGKYAAHTLNCNTGSIGVSMACMYGAQEGKTNGSYPMTHAQFDAMCKDVAKLCLEYGIPVTRTTVLSHAEVQNNLKIPQRGKWDFTVLPFEPMVKGAGPCGDYARELIKAYMNVGKTSQPSTFAEIIQAPTVQQEKKPNSFLSWLRNIFGVKA